VSRLVAVVGRGGRVRDTVRYALREGRDAAQDAPGTVAFLVPVGDGPDCMRPPAAAALADRVRTVVVDERLVSLDVTVETVAVAGADADTRRAALAAAVPSGTARVVLLPTFEEFTRQGVADALGDRPVAVERAPVGRRVRPATVAYRRSVRRVAATFALAFGFYLVLGDPTDPFDLVTGAISASVVAAVLSGVVFERDPSLATLRSVARAVVFLPYLLAAVVRANLGMAAVVLDPRLPIDPEVVRIPAPESRLARALLANSITLTPGTLTVDVVGDELVVHALTAATRDDLLAGSLPRTVAFVTGDGAYRDRFPTAADGGDQ